MPLVTRKDDNGVSEEVPMLPLQTSPAPLSDFVQLSSLEVQGVSRPIASATAATAQAFIEPGGSSVPENLQTLGLLDTVSVSDAVTILKLVERVDTRLHAAAQELNLELLQELLDAGAPPAALDWEGRTPLHVCVEEYLMSPLELLLRVPGGADVRDASGLPLLHVALLHGCTDGAEAALAAGARVDTTAWKADDIKIYHGHNRYPAVDKLKLWEALFQLPIEILIQSGHMEMFETILTVAKRDGVLDSLNGWGNTALKTAIRENNLSMIQALLRKGASPHRVSDSNETVLHVAASRDPNVLKYFLDNTDVPSTFDISGDAPIHIAVYVNNEQSVHLLLNKFNNARVKSKRSGRTPLDIAASQISNESAEVILEKDLMALYDINDEGDNPLHTAVKFNNRDLAALLLKKGAPLSTKDKNGVSVLELISRHFHDAPNFFKHVFDGFIEMNFYEFYEVNVDYSVLTDNKDVTQMNVLDDFIRYGQSKVLIHPLIESLLYLKWRQFLPLFYTMIGLYTTFLVSFNIYMIKTFTYKDMNDTNLNSTSTNATPISSGKMPGLVEMNGGVYWLLILLTYISICLLLLQESLFINLKRYHYFASWESWVKIFGLVLCTLAPPFAHGQGPWPRHVACAALLLAWLQAMFLVSRFPRWGYYVLMFGKVTVNILKILVTATFLVVGFSTCFMIQYQFSPPFDGFFASFVKTLVMMSSEFDYEGLFKDHGELQDSRTAVRILFVVFVIFVAIVLMNFIIGVAVSDINDLNETGNIRRLEKQVELLSTFDALVYDGRLAEWPKKMFGNRRYHRKMTTCGGYEPPWYVNCDTQQMKDNFCIKIRPATLFKAIIDVANKNYKRSVKENIEKTFKSKINELYDEIVDRRPTDEEGIEIKLRPNDSNTIKQQIKSILNELSIMSHQIENVKRSNEELNFKISQLSAMSVDILTTVKEMSVANMSLGKNTE